MGTAFRIGNIEIASRVLVAPMSGVTDLPFRRVLQRYRPGFVVSEMVAGRELSQRHADTERRAAGQGEIEPLVVQLVGHDPEWMARGAARAEAMGAAVIDINMGCPARKVTGALAGSGLMRDLDHAGRIIAAVVGATSRPVTLKMRLGWDEHSLNAPDLARRAESLGVRFITVHGRTRCALYSGEADWKAVRDTAAATTLPVAVNGDIHDTATARAALAESGACAVMVGRALVGRPWDLAAIMRGLGETPGEPGLSRAAIATAHFRDTLDTYGEARGVRTFRKHLAAYLDAARAPDILRRELMRSLHPAHIADELEGALAARYASAGLAA